MRYPKRISQHIQETTSWKILSNAIPDSWIIREVSERDYGIDSYIEIVNSNGNLMGDLVSIQLKSIQKIKWNKAKSGGVKKTTYSRIKKSTINYLFGLQVPVFLCIAEISTGKVFFANVKSQIRKNYTDLVNKKTFPFALYDCIELNKTDDAFLFFYTYLRERDHDNFIHSLTTLLIHYRSYIEFIELNIGRDYFLEVEPEAKLILNHLYYKCKTLSFHFGMNWEQKPLEEWYKKDKEQWKSFDGDLHENTITEILECLKPIFIEVVKKAVDLITKKEFAYWLRIDTTLFHYCLNEINI